MRVGRPGHFVGSDDSAELSNALANFGFLQARITKHQALARVPQEISGYTVDSYAARRRLFDDGLFGSATVEPEHDVDARAVAGHLHAIPQIFVNRFEQRGAARSVAAAEAAQVAFVHSRIDKFCEGLLFQRRGVAGGSPFY